MRTIRFVSELPADAKVGEWAGEAYVASPSQGLFRVEGDRLVPVMMETPMSYEDIAKMYPKGAG